MEEHFLTSLNNNNINHLNLEDSDSDIFAASLAQLFQVEDQADSPSNYSIQAFSPSLSCTPSFSSLDSFNSLSPTTSFEALNPNLTFPNNQPNSTSSTTSTSSPTPSFQNDLELASLLLTYQEIVVETHPLKDGFNDNLSNTNNIISNNINSNYYGILNSNLDFINPNLNFETTSIVSNEVNNLNSKSLNYLPVSNGRREAVEQRNVLESILVVDELNCFKDIQYQYKSIAVKEDDEYSPLEIRETNEGVREGLCRKGTCENVWLDLGNEKYSNHLILKHGISPRYLQPFLAPLEIRNSTARIPIRFQDGMCFKCDSWIPKVIEVELGGFKNMEMWWKHAAECHLHPLQMEKNMELNFQSSQPFLNNSSTPPTLLTALSSPPTQSTSISVLMANGNTEQSQFTAPPGFDSTFGKLVRPGVKPRMSKSKKKLIEMNDDRKAEENSRNKKVKLN